MQARQIIRRFFIPGHLISLYYYLKFQCMISPRAEVELSNRLRIGAGTTIGSFTKIRADDGDLLIGRDVQITTGCEINSGYGGLSIGNDCMIGACTSIIGNNYRYDRLDVPIRLQEKTSKGLRIGDNVWIGSGSRILDGSVIGNGVIVTPNSVVSGNIPDNVIVQGNPAKVIFRRR